MWVQGGREFPCEEFDDTAILFLLKCRAEHLPVFREVVGFVLCPAGFVTASDFCNFAGNEFLRRRRGEIAVVCGAVGDGGYVSVDSFGIFVPTEGPVDGFFPGEGVGPYVGEDVGEAPF